MNCAHGIDVFGHCYLCNPEGPARTAAGRLGQAIQKAQPTRGELTHANATRILRAATHRRVGGRSWQLGVFDNGYEQALTYDRRGWMIYAHTRGVSVQRRYARALLAEALEGHER